MKEHILFSVYCSLSWACGNVHALEQAYKAVVDRYNVDHLNFDIEGAASLNHAEDDLRIQALAQLQQDEKGNSSRRTEDVTW